MPKITLQVTNGPKWSAKENRFLTNGESVELEADTDEALAVLVARHSHHCKVILDGELPKSLRRSPGTFRRPDEAKVPPKGESSLPKPSEPSADASKGTKTPSKTSEAASGSHQCPKCFQTFKSERGLQIHFGHTKHDQEDSGPSVPPTIV